MFEKKHVIVIGKDKYEGYMREIQKYTTKCIEVQVHSGETDVTITFRCNDWEYRKFKDAIFKMEVKEVV